MHDDMHRLQHFIRLVVERAMSVEHIEGESLACMTFVPVSGFMYIILYEPNGIYNAIIDKIDQHVEAGRRLELRRIVLGIGRAQQSKAAKHLYAGIAIEQLPRCANAWTIGLVHAKQGWGPLIYDIAMSKTHEGLVPSRTSISSAAAKVWNYYMTRRDDVEKQPIPKGCKQYRKDGQEAFNLIYRSTKQPPDLSAAEARHEAFIKMLLELNDRNDGTKRLTRQDAERALVETFRQSFSYR